MARMKRLKMKKIKLSNKKSKNLKNIGQMMINFFKNGKITNAQRDPAK